MVDVRGVGLARSLIVLRSRDFSNFTISHGGTAGFQFVYE